MPNVGQVNNPAGANGATQAGGGESPYGTVKRLEQATRMAPIPAAPGVTAPKQAKRAAARQQTVPQRTVLPAPAPGAPPGPLSSAQIPVPVFYAQAWAAVAADPGASPLVQQIAQEAQAGVQA